MSDMSRQVLKMIPWDLISLKREQSLRELKSIIQKLAKHKDTQEISFADYPLVDQYIKDRFPGIDLAHVAIYLTSQKAMNSVGLKHMGGCYVDLVKTIFLLNDESLNSDGKLAGRFNKMVVKATRTTLKVADIFVHEALHAVSSAMQRATRDYKNAEEEFVYTHCVDFYRNNGMDDDEIIKGHFLPFCLNDIMGDKGELAPVFAKLKKAKFLREVPWEREYSSREYLDFLDKHAEALVPEIIALAKERARYMIECYDEYGCRSGTAEEVDYDTSVRFKGLNFD